MRVVIQRVDPRGGRVWRVRRSARLSSPATWCWSVSLTVTVRRRLRSLPIRPLTCACWRGEKSLLDEGAPVLAVSQFTLYGDAKKGRRPSWSAAAPGAVSEPLFNDYVQALRERGLHVETGVFGADMQVELVNDGPVTLILDSETL